MQAPDNQTPFDRVLEDWKDARQFYREPIELTERCKDFLWKQEHYSDDPGVTLDDARIAPKGAELNDLHRYKVAQIMGEGPYLECHPRDQQSDPYASEYAKRVLQSIIEDNTNRYSKFRRRVLSGALGVGTWYGMVHWKSDRGPMGDVVFESMGPDQVFPCPGYVDLHDPCCPSVIVERQESLESVKAKGGKGEFDWKDVDGLWPDCNGSYKSETDWSKAHGHPSPDDQYKKPTVTVLYAYYRQGYGTEAAEGGYRSLAPDQQYMACGECGYKDEWHERMPDGSLPEAGAACPECLQKVMEGQKPAPAYLYRVEREKLTEHRLKYPNGKLCIVLPHHRRTAYEGPWQAPTRSFPILQARAYESPYEQMGGTDSLLYWSLQALLDSLRKQGYDQMVTSKPILIFGTLGDGQPGLTDASGRPFLYDDTSGQIAQYHGPPGTISQMVHQFQGSGLPGSFPTLYNILSQSFYQSRGVGQVSFGPDQSKDVAYRSLLLQKESGDIPVEDHKQIWREEEGLFLGCVLDVWVHNSSEARAIRYLGDDGAMQFQLLRGSDIPNVDVVVGTPPQIKQGAIDEVNALTQWAQIPIASVRRIVARRLNLSPSEVAEVEAELSAQQQPQMPPGGAQNGTPMPQFSAGQGVPQP
ncbi:MAG TPA: hypothetical protein VK754_00265 [Propionibacteriaceae bacterium]|nr:hypothetical protein [Propionibacteriaceae bacterium]